ncbi:MAG: Rab family GTPase [Candidatus Thorarchaeota archaeon]
MSTIRPVFKTVLIGEGGVGKTSLAVRYTEDRFDQQMKMTIGVNFATKTLTAGGRKITLLLWDLGGQPRFQDVISDYFKGSKLAIAVYEVNRVFTLYRLDDWINRLHTSVPNCRIFFVGNKIDERMDTMGVSLDEADEFAAKYDAKVFEVSAKTGEGVFEMFDAVGEHLLQYF